MDLIDNPITEQKGYNERIFELFPQLEVLDGYKKDGTEYYSLDEEDEGEEGEQDYERDPGAEGSEEEGEFYDDDEEGELDYDDEYDDEDEEDEQGKPTKRQAK